MDELESLVVLSEVNSMKLIDASHRRDEIHRRKRDNQKLKYNVVITAGNKGMLRFFVLEVNVKIDPISFGCLFNRFFLYRINIFPTSLCSFSSH
jgi:hypothetical protein